MIDGFVDLGSGDRRCVKAENVLFFGIRGACQSWKQVSAYFLTPKNFKASELISIVKNIIHWIEDVGFRKVGLVCDGNSINRKIASDIGASVNDPSFTLDGKTRKIFV